MWRPSSLQPSGPRYLAIVERIRGDIASGTLRPGAQLPPQRDLAASLGVDLTTVSRAYAEATRRGLVSGQVGRGTFVRDNPAAATAPEAGALVDLSQNVPPDSALEEAERILAEDLSSIADRPGFRGLLKYQPNAGRADHRDAGVVWVAKRGVERPASQIVLACGAQHALMVLLTTLAPKGTAVMTESLTYPGVKALAELHGVQLVGVAIDAEGLVPAAFEKACKQGSRVLYCVPTLQNPTTAIMSVERRKAIAEIARRYRVTIIEDDAYGMLPRKSPAALSSFEPELSFFVSTLSKSVAPGLRIAFIAAPNERAAAQLTAGIRTTAWMTTPLAADIAARWITNGTASRLLAGYRAESAHRQRLAAEALPSERWRAHPDSYHGWLSLPSAWSSAEFVMHARRLGVILTPGDAFAVERPGGPAAVRLSLSAAPSIAALESALARLNRLLDSGPELAASLL